MVSYPPLELGQTNRELCPDAFSEASTLLCNDSVRVCLQISNQAVFVQFGIINVGGTKAGGLGNVVWGEEEPYLPIIGWFTRTFDAVRVRNRIGGTGKLAEKERTQVAITAIAPSS